MKTQNSFKTILSVLVVYIFTVLISAPAVQAQDEEDSMLLSMTEFVVKPGHNTQFMEGVKAWKECYLEHEGEWTWNMWSRVQGEGNVYGLTSFMENWAEMDDTTDEAGQACQNLALNLINPNVEKATRNMASTIPSLSRAPGGAMDVLNVRYWRLNNYNLFRETVSEVESTLVDVEGEPRSWWYELSGGDLNAPHFFVVTPYENFAAMDNERDDVWTVVENEHGDDKREELQNSYRESVDETWAFMWRRMADMSYSGAE